MAVQGVVGDASALPGTKCMEMFARRQGWPRRTSLQIEFELRPEGISGEGVFGVASLRGRPLMGW